MLSQFKVAKYIYAGYTVYVLVILDNDGYNVSEHVIRSESNNISLRQS